MCGVGRNWDVAKKHWKLARGRRRTWAAVLLCCLAVLFCRLSAGSRRVCTLLRAAPGSSRSSLAHKPFSPKGPEEELLPCEGDGALAQAAELTAVAIAFGSVPVSPVPFALLPGQRAVGSASRGTRMLSAWGKAELFSAFPSVGRW